MVHRIDRSAKRFKHAWSFKVYLTNPSMQSALFAPVGDNPQDVGPLAETAIFSQWFHEEEAPIYYGRWQSGEVDIVMLDPAQRPQWAMDVKWSDRYPDAPGDLKALIRFCQANKLERGWATSRTVRRTVSVGGLSIGFVPASVYCYTLGYNIIRSRGSQGSWGG